MLNDLSLMGRLVADPEYAAYDHGNGEKETSFARYRLAVERDYLSGETRPVDYITCKAFGSNARFVKNYFRKGDLVVVKGRIISEAYENTDGEKRFFTGVQVEKSYFARRRGGEDTAHNRQMAPDQDNTAEYVPCCAPEVPFDGMDEELPPLPEDAVQMDMDIPMDSIPFR